MKYALYSILAAAPAALAAVRGFNYASQTNTYDSFVSQFKTAASLEGANDYTSARLYTMIQEGTTNTPISAIQAAIDTQTTLLLGLWASGDQASFDNEITALKNAIQQYGSKFADLVIGISVGSEDLYRISPIGIENKSGYGQTPTVLVEYISQVRDAIKGTTLASKPVGHVDTWNVYVNATNAPVVAASDFLGLDEYPYFQTTDENEIGNAQNLFFEAYDKVSASSEGKPIWITEAGWPVAGPKSNLAIASVDNAETFWQGVACELERRAINTWWYILADAGASPSFGVSENGKPLYNLECTASSSNQPSTSSSSSTKTGSTASQSSGDFQGTVTETPVTIATSNPTATGFSSQTIANASGGTARPTTSQGSGSRTSSTSSASGAGFTGAAVRIEQSVSGILLGAAVAALVL